MTLTKGPGTIFVNIFVLVYSPVSALREWVLASLAITVPFQLIRPSRVTDRLDVDEIGHLSQVTVKVDGQNTLWHHRVGGISSKIGQNSDEFWPMSQVTPRLDEIKISSRAVPGHTAGRTNWNGTVVAGISSWYSPCWNMCRESRQSLIDLPSLSVELADNRSPWKIMHWTNLTWNIHKRKVQLAC